MPRAASDQSGAVRPLINTFLSRFDFPGGPHRLLDIGIGVLVIHEALLFGIESQRTACLDGDLGQIDKGAGAVTADCVESELLARLDCSREISELWRRVA